ncbi:MAG: hypothetical protein AAGC67_13035 [Myxococcota bacterium]
MASDVSRRPAIAGIGQLVQRVDDPAEAVSPIEMMENAIRKAAEDAGAPKLVEHLDAIYVPRGTWQYGNPGKLLGERLGSPNAKSVTGAVSGHIVQILLNLACREIAAGKADAIAIVGGESENSKRRILRGGGTLHWDDAIPGEPDATVGEMKYTQNPGEKDSGVVDATSIFTFCETSLRASLGETPAAHRDRIAELAHQMSRVAEQNPYAWIPRETSAEEIRNPSASNRMVIYPYTKLMTSNISVDQSAALIVCSTEAADRFGVPQAQRVFLRASTEMSKTITLSERDQLHVHPGQVLAAQRVLERAKKNASDLEHVDLYSCFPFAIQAGAAALGIATDPVPSLTGGMTFFGGPFGNYVLHSKATMVDRLRKDPGSTGAIGSVGGAFAHFSYGIYSTEPIDAVLPEIEDVSDEFARMELRPMLETRYEGEAPIESYTVLVGKDGPARLNFAAINPDGFRVWGGSTDPDLMAAALADEEFVGRNARFSEGVVTPL